MGARRGAKTRDEAQSSGAAGPSFERLSLSVPPVRYDRTMLCICAQRMHSVASPSASTSIACIAIGGTSLRLFELRMLKRGIGEGSLDKNICINTFYSYLRKRMSVLASLASLKIKSSLKINLSIYSAEMITSKD